MTKISRRNWLQKSLLATPLVFTSLDTALGAHYSNNKSFIDDPLLRLHWNENPYGPSPVALEAATEALKVGNRYPDPIVDKLKQAIATKNNLETTQVLITAGSTEVLSLLGQHVGLQAGEILTPWPSFPTMMIFGENTGARIRKINLDAEDRIDLQEVTKAISAETKLIFICNPNNPTSTEVNRDDLIEFCRQIPQDKLICVDEAYIEYSRNGISGSMVELVRELPNLIICRTFSKAYGLAGLRIGYVMSSAENITALRLRHSGWELSAGVASVSAAFAALNDSSFLEMCVEKNKEGKRIVYDAFDKWGVQCNRSSTNFLYARSRHFHADVINKMRAEKILLTKWPDMKDHIRISIGKPEQMEQFVSKVEKYLA